MAMAQLLLRGMMVGLVTGLFAFGFAKVFGEPSIDRSIAVESAIAKAKGEAPEAELVGRDTQATVGLLAGLVIVGTALGGLFAILFALGYGRVSSLDPRGFAALAALVGFVAIYLVPNLKYPANPPAIGEPETIGLRTALYFSTIALSAIAAATAFSLRRLLVARVGAWNASLAGALAFVAMVGIGFLALPAVDEVPGSFPAQTLWSFRLASLGIQAVLWGTIGLGFGAWMERAGRPSV